jgi:ATP/maltotriose-dependent transcriptional regulator MalT/DNA-binding SARP family transcriptional activator
MGPLDGRLTVVSAAAGYGKTTAVRAWLGDTPAQWLHGGDLVAREQVVVDGGRVTVIDDLHLAPDDLPPPKLVDDARLILVTRAAPPQSARPAVEIGPARLALSAGRTARLLRRRYGVDRDDVTDRVHRATGGWPMLVHLLGVALAAGNTTEDAAADYLATEVLAGLPAATARLLGDAAWLGSISVPLATDLGHARPGQVITRLALSGLLDPPRSGHAWYRPVPAVAAAVRVATPRSTPRRRRVLAAAADWHRRHDRPADALRLALAAGDPTGCAALLTEHGPRLLADGAAAAVVAAVRALPPRLRDEALLAEALEMTGDTAAALETYARLCTGDGPLPAAFAWRYGMAVYMWGDARDALRILRRGESGGGTADDAMLSAWTAAAHWLAGDAAACRDCADRAYRIATAAGDDRALANAHVALALCANLTGDPAALRTHYAKALTLAERIGDVVLVTRIRVNSAASLERQGRNTDALETVRPAVALARRADHVTMYALAACNEAMLLHRLGRLDEAARVFASSIEAYQRVGSRKVAYPLFGLGDLHRERGRHSEARACYEEAVRAASGEANRQGLVPALAGLARVVAADDPAAAAGFAERALAGARGPHATTALVATGWVALHAGDRAAARDRAGAAADAARRHRDRPGLAEALELRAAATPEAVEARQALTEALAIWRDANAGLKADRVRVALGALAGVHPEQRLDARLAADRLRSAGVVAPEPPADDLPAVEIRTLGRFAVLVGGAPVPATAWQSRKARDLVRILVARRGRPVPRDELVDLLWGPDAGDDDRIGHRLAVVLSTARGVLDPGRRAPADHFIAADQANVALNLDRVAVDVEGFLAAARHGLRLHARGETADALAVLTAAEAAFAADVYADEPYDDWARALREEARAAYLHVVRVLVELSRHPDDAVRHLLRILAVDPYDEQAHRDLVTTLAEAGRYGEARRACDRYVRAMGEIGVPARAIRALTTALNGP